MNSLRYELSARFDSRASFYGKAQIEETNKYYYLVSYCTKILKLEKETQKITFLCSECDLTSTTNRHINEFLLQYTNEGKKSKNDLLKMIRG